ncbi:hypothetical protein HDU97_007333 [Phlyctochytrium planicorne]|nr:hypothetical protein HDU97_007333 [Phlyctochytrium planicorne]
MEPTPPIVLVSKSSTPMAKSTRGRKKGSANSANNNTVDFGGGGNSTNMSPSQQRELYLQDQRPPSSPLDCMTLVCHASLWSPNGKEERNIVVNPRGHGDDDSILQSTSAASHHIKQRTPSPPYDMPPNASGFGSRYPGTSYGAPPSFGYPQNPSIRNPSPQNPGWTSSNTQQPIRRSPVDTSPAVPAGTGPSSTGTISYSEAMSLGLLRSQRLCQTLVGSLAVPCTILTDLDGTDGMFFVFHDLSVRAQGTYRLKFQVIDADGSRNMSAAKAVIWTNVFEVFSPKVFPGMTESTPLSRSFAKQGLAIHIRKDYASVSVTANQVPLAVEMEGDPNMQDPVARKRGASGGKKRGNKKSRGDGEDDDGSEDDEGEDGDDLEEDELEGDD